MIFSIIMTAIAIWFFGSLLLELVDSYSLKDENAKYVFSVFTVLVFALITCLAYLWK